MRGSGGAADLLADVFILIKSYSSEENDEDNLLQPKDQAQAVLKKVIHDLALEANLTGDAAKDESIAAIDTLKKWESAKGGSESDVQRSVDLKLRKLFCESYGIIPKGKSYSTAKNIYKYLRHSLEAVGKDLVHVFDLKNSSADFNREMLKCALKSIDSFSSPGDSLGQRAWYKLKYTMKSRDDLVPEQLIEVLNEGFFNGF